MKKLTKEQTTAIEALVASCTVARDTVQDLVEEYNNFINGWNQRFEEAVEGYNAELNELSDIYTQAAEDAQEYYDERSEAWQNSETGENYSDWIGQLENPDLDELDIVLPEPIEDLTLHDWDNAEEWLPPQEPEG